MEKARGSSQGIAGLHRNRKQPGVPKWFQPEGFHLMQYCCASGHEITIWNSRDGVTPFGVTCPTRDCRESSKHINWRGDIYAPDHKPKTGDYVFVDLTYAMAVAYRIRYVERFWSNDMEKMFGTKKEAVERLAKGDVDSFAPHTPHLTRWE